MAATDLVSLADAKDALGGDRARTVDDVLLGAWVTAISQRLDEECGPLVQRTITSELHDGGGVIVALDYRPVASVTSVVEYDVDGVATTLTAETVSTRPASGFLLSPDTGFVFRRQSGWDYAFPIGRRNVAVTYVAGRFASTATVDQAVKRAALVCVRHMWGTEHGAGSPFGAPQDIEGFGPGWAIPRRAQDLLLTYRQTSIGIA